MSRVSAMRVRASPARFAAFGGWSQEKDMPNIIDPTLVQATLAGMVFAFVIVICKKFSGWFVRSFLN